MKKIIKTLEHYDLGHYVLILLRENTSNSKPYHNLYHTLCVAEFCYKIGKYLLLYDEMRILLLSAIFHDFNHYSKNDAENVLKAIESYLKYSCESDFVNEVVIKNITATQYPYVVDDSDLTVSQKIIRDADLLQWTKNRFIEHVIMGLSTELEVKVENFVDMQKKFMFSLKYYTEEGQKIYNKNINNKLQDVNKLKELLGI